MIERRFTAKYFLDGTVPVLSEIENRFILVVKHKPGREVHVSTYPRKLSKCVYVVLEFRIAFELSEKHFVCSARIGHS